MTFNNFKNRLLEVLRNVCDLKDFLQEYVETVLDEDEYNKYEVQIDDVLWNLRNVETCCENLVNEMCLNGDID